jgi:hypothetical protein
VEAAAAVASVALVVQIAHTDEALVLVQVPVTVLVLRPLCIFQALAAGEYSMHRLHYHAYWSAEHIVFGLPCMRFLHCGRESPHALV